MTLTPIFDDPRETVLQPAIREALSVLSEGRELVAVVSGAEGRGGLRAAQSVVERLQTRADRVEPWHISLLRAVGEWELPEEEAFGRSWHYIIGGEALNWLALAQRLCLAIPDVVPPEELEALLFFGRLPGNVSAEQFRQLVGPYRYTAHLNFWYGVVVEEALQLVTEESIRKSRIARCFGDSEKVVEEACQHLYGGNRAELATQFLEETGGRWGDNLGSLSLAAWNEFTYWLFKRRVRKWHPARVASDTRRGLDRLSELRRDGSEDAAGVLYVPDDAAPVLLSAGRRP